MFLMKLFCCFVCTAV